MLKKYTQYLAASLLLAPSLVHAVPSIIDTPVDTAGIGFCVSISTQCTEGWSFWQHRSGAHASGGGIGGANDFYAWDINLNTPVTNTDQGKPVYAVESGDIYTGDGWDGKSYGQLLINHNSNGELWSSGYLHLSSIVKTSGTVSKGEVIGYISNTSPDSITPHLHFAVYNSHGSANLTSVDVTFQAKGSTPISSNDSSSAHSGYVQGIDVSHHQGVIDWAQVAADPDADFAYIKATEGALSASTDINTLISLNALDSAFSNNADAALNNGLFVGFYHFARPDLNPGLDGAEQEAKHFARFAAPYYASHAMLPPALDLENPDGVVDLKTLFDAQTLSDWVNKWLQTVHTELGMKPIVYTFSSYNSYVYGLDDYPLWVARYPLNDGVFRTPDWFDVQYQPTSGNWPNWTMWQYTSLGASYVDGINSNGLDRNAYYGSLADLKTWANTLGGIASTPIISSDQLPIPSLLQPVAHTALNANSAVDLRWSNNSVANTWRILVATNAAFELSADGKICYNCVLNEKTSSPNYSFASLPSGSYFIIIRAGHDILPASNWSTPSPFYVRLPKTQLLSPGNGSVLDNPRPALDWSDVTQSDIARVQVANSANFPTIDAAEKDCPDCLVNITTTSSQYVIPNDLASGTYYWRVRVARNANSPVIPDSGWSETAQFQVNSDPTCATSSYAEYDAAQARLSLPFVDLPNFNSLTGQPTGTYTTLSVQLQLRSDGLELITINPLTAQPNIQCHTQVLLPSIELNIPFVAIPAYVELGGQQQMVGTDLFAIRLGYLAEVNRFGILGLEYLGRVQ